jgi:3-methyladenine DNA glycosylase/8-oxoguanine DNA glycosylase
MPGMATQKPSRPTPPELPGPIGEDLEIHRLAHLAREVRREPGAFSSAKVMAEDFGGHALFFPVIFRRHFQVTAEEFLERAREDALCRTLLADPRPPVELALKAGWSPGRSRDLDERLRRAVGLTPGELREIPQKREFVLQLPLDYRADATLRYLGRDPASRSERVVKRAFAKGVRLAGQPALLTVEVGYLKARCRIEIPGAISPAAALAALIAVRRLLGLTLDPAPFESRLRSSSALDGAAFLGDRAGLRLPQAAEPFEGLSWAIVGQQVNLAFAATLRRRVVELRGEPIPGEGKDGLLAPPSPEAVAELDPAELTARQFSRSKAEYLIGAARAIVTPGKDALPLDSLPEGPATFAERRLRAVRGIGAWTAQYVLLRACGFPDCVPVGDSGLAAGLVRRFQLDHRPGPEETLELLAPFIPFRSFATAHLWASLGDPP